MRVTSSSNLISDYSSSKTQNSANNTSSQKTKNTDKDFFQAVEDFFQPIWPFPPEKSEADESGLEAATESAIQGAIVNILA